MNSSQAVNNEVWGVSDSCRTFSREEMTPTLGDNVETPVQKSIGLRSLATPSRSILRNSATDYAAKDRRTPQRIQFGEDQVKIIDAASSQESPVIVSSAGERTPDPLAPNRRNTGKLSAEKSPAVERSSIAVQTDFEPELKISRKRRAEDDSDDELVVSKKLILAQFADFREATAAEFSSLKDATVDEITSTRRELDGLRTMIGNMQSFMETSLIKARG